MPAPTDSKFLETPFASRVFTMLDLHSFNDEELHAAFEKIDLNHDGVIEKSEVQTHWLPRWLPRWPASRNWCAVFLTGPSTHQRYAPAQ